MSTPTAHTANMTEGDVNTLPGPDTPPGGRSDSLNHPASVGTPTPAREGNSPNHSEPDTDGGLSTPPATPPVNTLADTEGDNDTGPPQLPEGSQEPSDEAAEGSGRAKDSRPLRERLKDAGERWGLDLIPTRLADEGLPPLNHARSWAERGTQAPATGPARTAYRAWDHTSRPPRYALAVAYHVLSRPGRAAVAFVTLALLLRVPGVKDALAIAFALADAITYYTGLQWVLGLT